MSDTENKTENSATTDTAPYMKKDKTADSKAINKKSNFVIPLVLIMVSIIVVAATFYQDKPNDVTAQSDETAGSTQTKTQVNISQVEVLTNEPAAEVNTETTVASNETSTQQTATTEIPAAAAEVTTASNTVATNATNNDDSNKLIPQGTVAVSTPPIQVQAQTAQAQPWASDSNRYNTYDHEQAKAKAQQHMAMLQQRRQAYEQEMQTRRSQYEAAMKAEQERRSHIVEAQKAAYQRAHEKQIETGEKLQLIYKKIDQLHKEIDQIMREYYASQRAAASVPMHTL